SPRRHSHPTTRQPRVWRSSGPSTGGTAHVVRMSARSHESFLGPRLAQAPQHLGSTQRGHGGLLALVLLRLRQPRAIQRLLFGVTGQYAVANRLTLVEAHSRQPLSHRITDILEVRCSTTNHHTEYDHGIVSLG